MAAALGRVWGVFEAALARFHDDERTAEHLCRAPRYALRTAVRTKPWCFAITVMYQAGHECLAERISAAFQNLTEGCFVLLLYYSLGASGRTDHNTSLRLQHSVIATLCKGCL